MRVYENVADFQFMNIYRKLISNGRACEEAYRLAEHWHKNKHNRRRYKNYLSFRNSPLIKIKETGINGSNI